MNVSEDLKNKAISLGLCDLWQAEWKPNTSKEDLVRKYLLGLDFCIENNYPTNDYMVRHFDGIMQKFGVFVSEKVDVNNTKLMVLNGECQANAVYDGFSVGNIYVRHDSNLHLEVKDSARVFISLYDHATLDIRCAETAKVIVNRFGSGKVIYLGNVKIRDKRNGTAKDIHTERD